MKIKATLLALVLACHWLASAAVEVGQPAPDFTATDINGKTHRLSDHRGKLVVLEAINLDCPFSANHYTSGAMPELQAEVTGKGGVWFLVNSVNPKHPNFRTAEAAKKEVEKYKIKATAWLADATGQLGKLYGMKTTPHMFVIDSKGILVYDGAIDNKADSEGDPRKARNYVREAIERIKAGKPVEVSRSKPYGCTVKYAE